MSRSSAQFKMIPPHWRSTEGAPGRLADFTIADVQLVGDELASDALFTLDHSVASGAGKSWRAMRQHLPAEQLERISRFTARLLERLIPAGHHWVWFVDGIRFTDDQSESTPGEYFKPEAYYQIESRDEILSMGGRVGIFELESRHVAHYARMLGQFDAVHAVATKEEWATVLEKISLHDPVPSTEATVFSRRSGVALLLRFLDQGGVFVEEVMNGTRLRIVGREIADLTTVIGECATGT